MYRVAHARNDSSATMIFRYFAANKIATATLIYTTVESCCPSARPYSGDTRLFFSFRFRIGETNDLDVIYAIYRDPMIQQLSYDVSLAGSNTVKLETDPLGGGTDSYNRIILQAKPFSRFMEFFICSIIKF